MVLISDSAGFPVRRREQVVVRVRPLFGSVRVKLMDFGVVLLVLLVGSRMVMFCRVQGRVS